MADLSIPHPCDADVYVCPTYLQAVVGLTPKHAKQIAQRLVKIAEKRWPKAVVKIHPGNVDYVGSFIEVSGEEASVNKHIPDRDIDFRLWNDQGAVLKTSVTDKMFLTALDLNRPYSSEKNDLQQAAMTKVLKRKYSAKRKK